MDAAPLGLGTMQLTGEGAWGPPEDRAAAVMLLRTAYEWGVRVFDSAWYYGPEVTHRLLAEALLPYPDDLVIVTKAGNSRGPNRSWRPALTPLDLRTACENDLRLLRLEGLPLALLRWHPTAGDEPAFAEALGTMVALRDAGKIRRVGLSNVARRHLVQARKVLDVAAVSNAFSIGNQRDREVLVDCATTGVPYMPYYPLLGGAEVSRSVVETVAREARATPAQVAIAWLRAQSPVVLPIPGTSSVRHLRENLDSGALRLRQDQLERLGRIRFRGAG